MDAKSSPQLLRDYGSPMVKCIPAAWGGVRATLIRRERIAEVRQSFHLPYHVFRLGVSGRFGPGSTTALGGRPAMPLPQNPDNISFYPSGTMIVNEVTRASRLTYLTVEIGADVAARLVTEDASIQSIEPWASLDDEVAAALLRTFMPPARDVAVMERLYAEQAALMLLLTTARKSPLAIRRPRTVNRRGMAAPQLQQIADYLMDRLSEDVSLEDLAAVTGMSATHLCRAFSQSTGKTPHRWRQTARIERAKNLLTDPKLSIFEIGLAVGFAGQSQFTTAFRRETGTTPWRWRSASIA